MPKPGTNGHYRPDLNSSEGNGKTAIDFWGLDQAPVRDSVFIYVSKILEEKYLLVSDFITNSKFVPVFLDLAFGNSYYSIRRV